VWRQFRWRELQGGARTLLVAIRMKWETPVLVAVVVNLAKIHLQILQASVPSPSD
jgi:hypothetical protein